MHSRGGEVRPTLWIAAAGAVVVMILLTVYTVFPA